MLRDAIWASVASDYDVLAFESWNTLADAFGAGDREIGESEIAGRNAEAFWLRLDRDPFLGAKLFAQRGLTALSDVRLDETRELLNQALELLESSAYDDDPLEVRILGGLAAANAKSGRLSEAVDLNRRAESLSASLYGSLNPQTLSLQLNRGNMQYLSGDYREAIETHSDLLKKYEKLYGAEHKDTARTIFNLAVENLALGNNEAALGMLERAVAIRTSMLGATHPSTLRGEQAVVHTLKELERYDEAVERAQSVIAAQRATLGDEHYDIAYSLVTLSEIRGLQGRFEDGIRIGTEAAEMVARVMGPEHPFHGEALTSLGVIYERAGERSLALGRFRSAIEGLKSYDGDATLIAKARFHWAKAAWPDGDKREQAVQEARSAAETFETRGKSAEKELAEVRAWLESHRPAIQ
ncbi:MAG: tetratricopeptide repeat protein [Myxococcota bacterium]